MAEIRVRITLTATTEEALAQALQHAYAVGNYRLMRRVLVLMAVARGEAMTQIAQLWDIARQSVYNWLVAFLAQGLESLPYKRPSGRPPKLTPKQRAELQEVLKAGPQAAGYRSACWTTVLIQQLISKRWGVLYSRQYLADLLHGLGFSYQKAKFVSDHLDERRRRLWMKKHWPRIWRKAQQRQALLLFGDEASFPQWGSLSYTWAPVGQQPLLKTSGKRKGYKVFGMIDFFTGKLFYQAITARFNAETYQAFLLKVLADTPNASSSSRMAPSITPAKPCGTSLRPTATASACINCPPIRPTTTPSNISGKISGGEPPTISTSTNSRR